LECCENSPPQNREETPHRPGWLRAKAVVDALVKDYGISAKRLNGKGVGPLSPVGTNKTEEGRQLNRRVELVER